MTDTQGSAGLTPLVSRNAARESFRKALRHFVGRGKRYSVKELANGAGVPDRVIEGAMAPLDSGEYRYPAEHVELSIASFIGPEFTTLWLSEINQGAYWLPETDGCFHELARDASEYSAEFLRSTDETSPDGRGLHASEKANLRLIANRIGPRAAGLGAAA